MTQPRRRDKGEPGHPTQFTSHNHSTPETSVGPDTAVTEATPRHQEPGERLVWLVEGDDHEYELVTAATAEEAVGIAADLFTERYADGEEDGYEYSADLLTPVAAFRGESDDPGSLSYVPLQGVSALDTEAENKAYDLLDYV